MHGVNFKALQGEMVAIMGASGSGKSTLLNIIGCLDKPTEGTYILDGENISNLNKNPEIKQGKRDYRFYGYP